VSGEVKITPTERRILEFLDKEKRPISPREIAKTLELNYDSVRQYVLRLFEKGLVIRPFRGHYTIHPMGVGPFTIEEPTRKVHNVMLAVAIPFEGGPEDVRDTEAKVVVGNVSVGLKIYGAKRKAVGYLSCKDGFDTPKEIQLGVELFRRLLFEKTGWLCPLKRIGFVARTEFIHDYEKVSVDVPFCVTYETGMGDILKIYRHKGHVRVEKRTKPTSLQTVLDYFIRGYVTPQAIYARLNRLERRVRDLGKAQKFTNEVLVRILDEIRSHA